MPTKRVEVAIIGASPLAREITELCRASGLAPKLCATRATRIGRATRIVVDTLPGPAAEKKARLASAAERVADDALILSSCLGFSAARIASWVSKPARVVGFATFYPLAEKKVVELSAGRATAADAVDEAEAFFVKLGKGVVCANDAPGLIFPRVLSLLVNEAARALSERIAHAEAIDLGMRLGTNYPLGPLRWADRIGIDEVLAVLDGLRRATGNKRYRAAPILRKMAATGRLGEKSGRGFYRHDIAGR
jgi:3-hydroxybutyryl-CoA dehydrogenase